MIESIESNKSNVSSFEEIGLSTRWPTHTIVKSFCCSYKFKNLFKFNRIPEHFGLYSIRAVDHEFKSMSFFILSSLNENEQLSCVVLLLLKLLLPW